MLYRKKGEKMDERLKKLSSKIVNYSLEIKENENQIEDLETMIIALVEKNEEKVLTRTS